MLAFPHDPMTITATHGNIKEEAYSLSFFESFDIVLNALDNVDALVVKRVPPTSTTMRSVRRFSSGCCGVTRRRLRDDEDMVS